MTVAYPAWPVVAQTHTAILNGIREQPGIVAAGSGNFLPLEVGWRVPFRIEGEPPPARPEDAPQVQIHSVSEGFFEALGAQIARGRAFGPITRVVRSDTHRPRISRRCRRRSGP